MTESDRSDAPAGSGSAHSDAPAGSASAGDHGEAVDVRSDFPKMRPTRGAPSFGRFVADMRTLQDLAVSIDAPEEVLVAAAEQAEKMAELLSPYVAPEGVATAGRAIALPGRGSLLIMPWTIEAYGPDEVRWTGAFRRYHLGGNGAAHGGTIALLFDDMSGMTCYAKVKRISRTAYLHVNYRKVVPINTPLIARGHTDRVEGRKTYVRIELTDQAGTVLADAEALMVALLPGQP